MTNRNITIDPLAAATPVDDPQIVEVIELGEGKILNAKEFIGSYRYGDLVTIRLRVREELKEAKPRFVCPMCHVPVYIVANPIKHFFFRHLVEDSSCPARTRDNLTEEEIRARKYHGLKESEAHKRIKRLIDRSLRADSTFIDATILMEKHWRSALDPKRWRQPDVQAVCGSQRIAFEAQLSTTFLDVVVGRRLFYKSEGALLVWVLGSFLPEFRRMTTDDLLFSNNSNVLVVDEETTLKSEETGVFYLRCFYRRPFLEGDKIEGDWQDQVVRFSELTHDVLEQRIYFFDYQGEERRLRETLDAALREEFFKFWEATEPNFENRVESAGPWNVLKEKLEKRGVALPATASGNRNFRSMIHALLSALHGKPVGWQFDALIQVAHHLALDHPQHLLAFGYALESSGHKATLAAQDGTRKWARKKRQFWQKIQNREPEFLPDTEWLPALSFLFPEVGARIKAFLDQPDALAHAHAQV